MSRVLAQIPEPVIPENRRAMTPARKARIWKSRKGICWMCNFPVPETGPEVRYDHKLAIDLGGSDDDENLWPLHREPCDRIKTASDRQKIDKRRRQSKLRLDVPREVSATPIRSRGFGEPRRVPAKSRKGR